MRKLKGICLGVLLLCMSFGCACLASYMDSLDHHIWWIFPIVLYSILGMLLFGMLALICATYPFME